MPRLDVDHVYVIHVSTGAEERAASIERQLARHGIDFEYVLEGDMKDLTPEWLDRWFDGVMKCVQPRTSCCSKHLIAYQRMLRDGWRDALVLEDDIFLADDFVVELNASLGELRKRQGGRTDEAFISLENSGLRPLHKVGRYVPGTTLYRAVNGRDTGAYWLARTAAERFLARAETEKVAEATPFFQRILFRSGTVELYWRHPPIAEQGSHSGKFDSLLTVRRTGLMRRPRWLARKWFQLYLRPFIDRLRGVPQ
jgi:GR25 family glycosyltransferase involved in LPS biosynthesis